MDTQALILETERFYAPRILFEKISTGEVNI